jgi:hypothetical protein
MNRNQANLFFIGFLILLVVIIGAATWINFQYVSQNRGMNKFTPRWQATRSFLMQGTNPYSEQATNEIQRTAYGRLAKPDEDPGYFVYPFYSIILYAPFSLIENHDTAFALWMTVLEFALAGLIIVSLILVDWRPTIFIILVLFIYTFLWYHGLRPLISGNASVLVAFFATAALLAIRSNQDAVGGILLALSSIKPQMVVVLYIFIILWSIVKGRWRIIWTFLGSLTFLIIAGSLFFPDWLLENVRQIIRYSEIMFISTPSSILMSWIPGVGKQLGWLLTGLMVAFLLIEWRSSLSKDERWFVWTALMTLTASTLIGIYSTLENYIMLYPAAMLILATWDKRWGLLGRWLIFLFLVLTSIGIWLVLLNGVQRGVQPDLDPIIYFLTPTIILVGLYWVKWWAVNPDQLLLQKISDYLK